MKLYKCITKTKALIVWCGLLLLTAGLFVFAAECKKGALDGILMCVGILVPSLFPFYVISAFMGESSLAECLAPLLEPVGKFLLKTSGASVIPLIMSLVGGYPIGARTVAALYKKGLITHNEASKISLIAFGAGPGFLVSFVGVSLLLSKESGIILLSSQIISMLTIALIARFTEKDKNSAEVQPQILPTPNIGESLVNAVGDSVKAMGAMCGFVILFSTICNVLTEGFNFEGIFADTLLSLLEITTGVTALSGKYSLTYISMMTAFGGICVHLQVFRELRGINFSKPKFYLYRIYQSIISLGVTRFLLYFFPVEEAVFSNISTEPQITPYTSIAGFAALTTTSVLFIFSLRKRSH